MTNNRSELLDEIDKYKSMIKSAENKIKSLEDENSALSNSGGFFIDKVADISNTLAKQAGNLLDNILSNN